MPPALEGRLSLRPRRRSDAALGRPCSAAEWSARTCPPAHGSPARNTGPTRPVVWHAARPQPADKHKCLLRPARMPTNCGTRGQHPTSGARAWCRADGGPGACGRGSLLGRGRGVGPWTVPGRSGTRTASAPVNIVRIAVWNAGDHTISRILPSAGRGSRGPESTLGHARGAGPVASRERAARSQPRGTSIEPTPKTRPGTRGQFRPRVRSEPRTGRSEARTAHEQFRGPNRPH